jgi:nicotinate-nucleotide--dimethylbenzimidazole phosphoribosyltransferase
VLSRQHGLPLHVLDVGVDGTPSKAPLASGRVTVHRMVERVAAGDIRTEDALSVEAFERCAKEGRRAVAELAQGGRLLLLGEMGIGNTTPAAAIASLLIGPDDPAELVGQGTGATGGLLKSKRAVVRDVVRRLAGTTDPIEILRRAGGRELAALFGAMTAALEGRTMVLVDGFIVTAVAAALVRAMPEARAGMIFAHRSDERGHEALLEHLEARPLLDLGMRLGEASGALAAYPLVEVACALHTRMATFASAGIPAAEP